MHASNIFFVILEGNDRFLFAIDEKTGILSCRNLDREMAAIFDLVVLVYADGANNEQITVGGKIPYFL